MPMVTQEIVRELLDLIAVHGFYVDALEHKLGHPVPLPKEAISPEVEGDDKAIKQSVLTLHRWLAVLDLAVEPLAIRDAVKESLSQETAEALLRYYIDKQSLLQNDRDKTDCINTFLFKRTLEGQSGPPEADRYFYIMQMAQKFEQQIYRMLGEGANIPKLHDEHAQLLREFEYLHQEVDDFRTFDQLMDSGIVQRVRDIKLSFATSFYHPDVLANVAVYNTLFGKRFDDLFRAAADHIKSFANKIQGEGASIMSKVEGDVTVKHLVDVKEEHIINQEYGKAQEHFRTISKFKKAVDKKGGSRTGAVPGAVVQAAMAAAAAAATPTITPGRGQRNATSSGVAVPAQSKAASVPVSGSGQATNAVEEGKIRGQLDALRTFVRVQEKSCFVVPLVKGALNITATEAESLRADYGGEKSFRADYVNQMAYLLAMVARLIVEETELRDKKTSSYLWKPHADGITYIMRSSSAAIEEAAKVSRVASQRGLEEKVNAMGATVTKLRGMMETAANTLKSVGTEEN
jgi:hypothetical protein